MSKRFFTINSRKFDGSLHRTWQAENLEETKDYWLFVGKFSQTVQHNELGIIRPGTISYEYFWKTRCYNVFRFHEPGGEFRNFYCNISLPPTLSENILNYVDLDIDLVVWKDYSYEILDLDEFEINSQFYNYPENLKSSVQSTLNELIHNVRNREFPFNLNNLKT